ncbi:putative chalcone isomerase, 3-layer sandwich, chalcone isomerase superfamily [Helianthus debilis subsp. tardiflorus]
MRSKRDELCGEHDYVCSSTKIDFVSYRRKALEIPDFFNKFSRFAIKRLLGKAKDLEFVPAVALAESISSRNFLAVSNEKDNAIVRRSMNHNPCEVEQRRCGEFYRKNSNFSAPAVEPRTSIEFPTISDNVFGESNASSRCNWIEINQYTQNKSIDVHPYDVCNKLGSKYASLPKNEVDKHHNVFADLLREDISMSVRLVVSYNGIKISTVIDAFEKSLRARLIKMNPDTDYDCLRSFSYLFSEDIPIRAVIVFEGKRIGAVHSRDLCRAFFDMYLGDGPVSEQTKTEIRENVTNIMRRC